MPACASLGAQGQAQRPLSVRERAQIQEVLSGVSAMPMRAGRRRQFKARFRRHAFGWKSQPAIERVRQAVTEIKQVARTEPIEAAEGAVAFIERLSPTLENVDSSSGAIGTAVNNAIGELVRVIAEAPADETTRLLGSSACSTCTELTRSRTSNNSLITGASYAVRPRSDQRGPTASSA
jgi:hypothetical protein